MVRMLFPIEHQWAPTFEFQFKSSEVAKTLFYSVGQARRYELTKNHTCKKGSGRYSKKQYHQNHKHSVPQQRCVESLVFEHERVKCPLHQPNKQAEHTGFSTEKKKAPVTYLSAYLSIHHPGFSYNGEAQKRCRDMKQGNKQAWPSRQGSWTESTPVVWEDTRAKEAKIKVNRVSLT